MSPYHLARTTTNVLRTSRLPPPSSRQFLFTANRTYASQAYGSGEGDPKGSNPQSQGANPATSNAEHPGPPPPDVGKGTGGGPTKKDGGGHQGGSADVKSSKSSSNDSQAKGKGKKSAGEQTKGGSPQPKILSEDGPPADENLPDDVKKHNEEMANRRDKLFEHSSRKEGDEVDKGFWKGELPSLSLLGSM